MQTENLISIDDFCTKHNIEVSFINSLHDKGLIETTLVNKTMFINKDNLKQLEIIVHFYYELDINLEGIETINHLLQRINAMQDEITMLKNRLSLYE